MKPNTKLENVALARSARQAIAKSTLDISELQVTSNNGAVELFGKVRAPRGGIGVFSLSKEYENLKNLIRATRGVKDVFGDRVRLVE